MEKNLDCALRNTNQDCALRNKNQDIVHYGIQSWFLLYTLLDPNDDMLCKCSIGFVYGQGRLWLKHFL